MINGCKIKLVLLSFFFIQCLGATTTLVYNQQQLHDALLTIQPGDSILLSDGQWKDVQLKIFAKGTKEKPVVIAASVPGETIITGKSNLKIGGEHIIINGLYFKDGYAPANGVIEYRIDNNKLANNCIVTNCAIENYSKPERFDTDSWIIFWGQYNSFSNNYVGDKLNVGTLLIVNLDDERSQNNYHKISNNFFTGRSRLGSNGGEMIRVGVSRYSLTASHTIISDNLFERCNGEVEIVSIKSGNNEIHNNLFYECEGALVLRHGDNNLVHDNLFIGNNKPFTGGVRVINSGHKIYNNVFKDLAGDRFHSAFAVMNGVPNSALNRYMPVRNVDIFNNNFINCKRIEFGAGKDNERTESPKSVRFFDNTIYTKDASPFINRNSDNGIQLSDINILKSRYNKETENNRYLDIKQSVGINWKKQSLINTNSTTTLINISPSQSKEINNIISASSAAVKLTLEKGIYKLTEPIIINKNVTVTTNSGKAEFINVSEKSFASFFIVENNGVLNVENISFNSAYQSYGDVKTAVNTTSQPMNTHYGLTVNNCEFYNFNESSYSCIKAAKGTFADTIIIKNSIFRNNSGTGIDYSAEKDDKGIYNVEYLEVSNCVFTNNLGSAVIVYRGGNDESTTGPTVKINHCVFNNVDNRERGCVIKLLGVQTASVLNSSFNNAGAGGRSIWFEENSWDKLKVDYCNFYNSGRVGSFCGKVSGKNIYNYKPQFQNPVKHIYKSNNPSLSKKASDGKAIGVL